MLNDDEEPEDLTSNTLDWEAIEVSATQITLRMLFEDYDLVSEYEEQNDVVYVTLNLARYTTSDGLYIPNLSLYSSELPLQMDPEFADFLEEMGEISSYIFLALYFINGSLNSFIAELDY